MKQNGFTLIELVVVVVIISALSIFAIGRFTEQASFDTRGYFDELVSATRFAQRYAVASGCTVRIQINASNYSLTTQDAACGAGGAVQGPDGNAFAGTAPAGVTVTSGTGPHDFDALGDTGAGGSVQVQGGSDTHTFMITASSGYVDL